MSQAASDRINCYIQVPEEINQLDDIKEGYHNIVGFPNVIRTVDGTIEPIIARTEHELLFITRTGFHAINMLTIHVSDHGFSMAGLSSRTNENSKRARRLEDMNFGASWLLGDSSNPLKKILKQVMNSAIYADLRYNVTQKNTLRY